MSQLVRGITVIPTTFGSRDNCFLVEEEDGYTLVDVGWKNAPRAIGGVLDESGRSWADVRRIILTHAHPDHVRGLKEAAARSGADVLIHRDDALWLEAGRVPPAGRSAAAGRLIDRVPLLHWDPVAATRTLVDGEMVGGLRVIHAPGHSPGHIVLFHEETSALLVGDAVFHARGLGTGPDALAADPAMRDASYELLPRAVSAVGFAHGEPIRGASTEAFSTWLDSVAPA